MDLKGKIAVVLINDPDFETGKGDFDGVGMTYYGRWTYKYEEGARQGALGVLVVHETAPASYGWDTVANANANTMFDVVRDHPRSAHPTLEGWIQRDLATELFKHAGLDFEALKKQAQTRGFKPVELKNQRLSASYQVKSDLITSHNVVARLEGSKHPNETLIYSAHWDHIGVGKPDARGDTIFNGALEKRQRHRRAAGAGARFRQGAKARALGGVPGRHRRRKRGLLGSEFYASKPLYPLDTTVAVINMDGMNPFVPSRDFGIYGTAKTRTARPTEARRRAIQVALYARSQAAGRLFLPLRSFFPSPSAACRRCGMQPARIGKWAAWRQARLRPTTTPPSAITSKATNGSRTGPSPAPHAIWACCMRWASSWPTRVSGRTGAKIRSSAPLATPAKRHASNSG